MPLPICKSSLNHVSLFIDVTSACVRFWFLYIGACTSTTIKIRFLHQIDFGEWDKHLYRLKLQIKFGEFMSRHLTFHDKPDSNALNFSYPTLSGVTIVFGCSPTAAESVNREYRSWSTAATALHGKYFLSHGISGISLSFPSINNIS